MTKVRGKSVRRVHPNGASANGRAGVGERRRGQIVEAAVAVIARQGLQNLSLSEIETQAGMSRGQLTYYFPTKESILLAVFDRLVEMMGQRCHADHHARSSGADVWDRLAFLFDMILRQPPAHPEFNALQFTFLSQIGHREDFRQRLATLYGEWRTHLADDVAQASAGGPEPRALASVIQALAHGLTVQLAADPDAFDRQEVLAVCLDLFAAYRGRPRRPAARRKPPQKGSRHE